MPDPAYSDRQLGAQRLDAPLSSATLPLNSKGWVGGRSHRNTVATFLSEVIEDVGRTLGELHQEHPQKELPSCS